MYVLCMHVFMIFTMRSGMSMRLFIIWDVPMWTMAPITWTGSRTVVLPYFCIGV